MTGEHRTRSLDRPRGGELLISEIFGPTLQGEGPSAGHSASFVRLGGCNLTCSWCDTTYSWDAQKHDLSAELSIRSTADVSREIKAIGSRLTILTGGEPGLQASESLALVRMLSQSNISVEIETNGTVPLGQLALEARRVVVSPKMANSGLPLHSRERLDLLRDLTALPNTTFKFVVRHPDELEEVDSLVGRIGAPATSVWIMPEGTDHDRIVDSMRALAGPVALRGWALSGRLHILLWGNTRGR